MDIVVTTPKKDIKAAAAEAAYCIANSGGQYLRRLSTKPLKCGPGDRVYYVEDGFIRGFAIVDSIAFKRKVECDITGVTWPSGYYITMNASSWHWVQPVAMVGFQGWRYFHLSPKIIGDWQDPRPDRRGRT